MSTKLPRSHPVADRRKALGWSQEELARGAGLPRSTVSAIEALRLTPSVTKALSVAAALGCSVEELFATGDKPTDAKWRWAWVPRTEPARYWEAEVGGRSFLYPAEAQPGGVVHDGVCRDGVLHERSRCEAGQTLVLAGCDPAAELLATEYAKASGFRLLAFSRGGGPALELLREGKVHVAALHRSTAEHPERNAETVRERLGRGYRLLRCADWEEGIVLPASSHRTSVNACTRQIRRWAMREPGSSARECLDELLERPRSSERVLTSHAAVADVVRSGWAEAGVCVRICAEGTGLTFLPVRNEALDLCFPASMERDPRMQALIRLLRSRAHRSLLNELPGYDASHTGELIAI